ncbi:MAG TPA: S8 family serine peptidase [Symbiobacteriaceae bacterium]|nr:S8 family serine peptidase [Symbiobacteriaceae bacterium]
MTPGVNITAAQKGTRSGYITYSGTSMATPFAAGVGALLLDANNSLSVADLKSLLYSNVEDWGPAGHDVDYGRGLLLAYNAVRQAAGGSGSFDDGLVHTYRSGSFTGAGQNYYQNFTVTDTGKPVAVTLTMTNWSGGRPDFDLYLIGPSGSILARSETTARQDQVLFTPTQTGTYRVRLFSYAGSGPWFFDLSYR